MKLKTRWALWRHKRLIEAEKRQRAKARLAASSTWARWSTRYKIWKNQRLQRQLQESSEQRSRKTRLKNFLFWLLVLLLVAIFCYVLLRDTQVYSPAKEVPALVVNGKSISQNALLRDLLARHGAEELQKMTEQAVVTQKAKELKIVLSPDEIDAIAQATKADPLEAVHRQDLQTALLLRKIILHGVDAKKKKATYEAFGDDLKMYQIAGYRFSDLAKATKFDKAVAAGTKIDQAAEKFATDGRKVIELGAFTIAKMEAQFGPATADALKSLKPGQYTRPLTAASGYAVYRLVAIGTTFEDVGPAIDNMIADKEAAQVLFDLLSKAKVESPYLKGGDFLPGRNPTSSPSPNK